MSALEELFARVLGEHAPLLAVGRGYDQDDNVIGWTLRCSCGWKLEIGPNEARTPLREHVASVLAEALGAEPAARIGHDDGAGGSGPTAINRPETFHSLYRLRGIESEVHQ